MLKLFLRALRPHGVYADRCRDFGNSKSMKRTLYILLALAIGFTSCKRVPDENENLEIARSYYQALDHSDGTKMDLLLADSIATVETEYDYKQTFSRHQYVQDWLRWDSIFRPSYTVLEISQEKDLVRARISKIDVRIQLLHGEPTVWKEVLRFTDGRIAHIERTNEVFNDTTWQKNVGDLESWVREHHPELDGFLYDQTREGGIKYLKAIDLYSNR